MCVKLWFSVNIYNSLPGVSEKEGGGRYWFSIIITTFADGRCPIWSGMTGKELGATIKRTE